MQLLGYAELVFTPYRISEINNEASVALNLIVSLRVVAESVVTDRRTDHIANIHLGCSLLINCGNH